MGILNHIIQSRMLPAFDAGQNLALSDWIATEFVGDQHLRNMLTADQVLAEEPDSSLLIATWMDHDLKHLSIWIDGTIKVLRFPVNLNEDLVDMALVTCGWTLTANPSSILMTKLETPAPDGFITGDNSTLIQDGFYIAIAQVEIVVKSDGIRYVSHGKRCRLYVGWWCVLVIPIVSIRLLILQRHD